MGANFGIPDSLPLKYTGPDSAIIPLKPMPRRPTTSDRKYPVGQFVILKKNPSTGNEGEIWYLANFDSSGDPQWKQFSVGSGSPGIDTVTTDDGAPAIQPDVNGNINVLGGTGITTSGQNPSSTVTVTLDVASNAETIAGAINNKAVVPSGLEAKIGTQTQYGVALGGGAGTAINWTAAGSDGQVLTGTTGANPSFGGIGIRSGLTNNGVILGQNNNAFIATAAGATNSVFVGNTGGAPSFSTTSDSYFDSIRFNNANPGTLDWFEDVTAFTPVIQGSTAAGVGTYTEQHGRYWRIGKMVHVEINITWTAHTGTGDMWVAGFPYVFGAATSFYPLPTLLQNITLPASTLWVCCDGVNNQTYAELSAVRDANTITQVQMDGTGSVYVMGAYLTA